MIYENIKSLATEQGMSIAELEKRAGLGNGVIGAWKNNNARLDTVAKVAKTLGVTVDSLMEPTNAKVTN